MREGRVRWCRGEGIPGTVFKGIEEVEVTVFEWNREVDGFAVF